MPSRMLRTARMEASVVAYISSQGIGEGSPLARALTKASISARWPLSCLRKRVLFILPFAQSTDFSEILNHSDPSAPCDLHPLFRKRLITACPVSDARYRPIPVAKCDKTLVVRNGWSIPSADRLGEDSHWQRSRQIGRKVNGVARFADDPPSTDVFILCPVISGNGAGVEPDGYGQRRCS